MKPGLPRTLLVEGIRYVGTAQAGPVVILHAAWMLLALAAWQDANADFTRPLVRAFVWLGGTDGHGVGNGSAILAVWGKISLVLYLIQALARRMFEPREPLRLWVLTLVSGGVALLGYGLAFLGDEGNGNTVARVSLSLLFAAGAAVMAAWAVLASRFAELLVRRLEEADPPSLPVSQG